MQLKFKRKRYCYSSRKFHISSLDIFSTGKDQFRSDNHFANEDKLYSPFNDYFGLANIIRGNAGLTIGEKEQVYPMPSNAVLMEQNLMRLRNTWHSNDYIHNNIKQSSEREHYGFENGGQTMKLNYGETLSNAIWNGTDTDSSTHTSPLTPSQTFNSFPPISSGLDNDLRIGAGIQHHIVSMLHAEAKLKGHARAHTGSIGDEDSLSDGSSNGIGPGRGIMSTAVSAALANGVSNMNGPDDSKYQRHRRVKLCVFCRNNGKPEEDYKDHILKDSNGRVVCPILRAYVCPTCGESGDNAHTLKYCPATQPTIIYSPGIPDNGMKW